MTIKRKHLQVIKKITATTMLVTFFLSSSSLPALAQEIYQGYQEQKVWRDVLKTDLTDYEGERFPLNLDEPGENQKGLIDDPPNDAGYETDRFIVKYKDTASVETLERSLKKAGRVKSVNKLEIPRRSKGKSLSRKDAPAAILNTDKVITTKELKQQLNSAALQEIEYMQPDYEMAFCALDEPVESESKPKPKLTAALPSNGITVALLDTGVDTNNPYLAGRLTEGYDFVNAVPGANSKEWYYDQGHGTSMAGAITAEGATVMPLKVFEGGKAYTSDIIAAITYAEENGAKIANMSFGSRFYNPALEEAMADSEMLFVCAAGNMLVNISKYPVYPASFDLRNVLTVAAVDDEDKLARFSNFGVGSVDIAARGVDISVPFLDNATVETSGTSVSAAIVSSAAAQTLATHSKLDAAGLKQRLIDSADHVTGLMDKVADGKRLNLIYAISAKSGPNTAVIDVPDPDPIPDVMLENEFDKEYEEFGADGSVSFRQSMPTSRRGLHAVSIGKKIYAISGMGNSSANPTAKAFEIYDTETDTWSKGADLPLGNVYSVPDICYADGGNIVCVNFIRRALYRYYPSTNSWNTYDISIWPSNQAEGGWAFAYDSGYIYRVGGSYYTNSDAYREVNTVYRYRISTNQWTQLPNLNRAGDKRSAFIYEGKMYIEGADGSKEIYDLSTGNSSSGSFSSIKGAPFLIKDNLAISVEGQKIWQVNIPNVTYQRVNSLTIPHYSAGIAMVDGVVYVIGGMYDKNSGVHNLVEAFELGYTNLATMPKKLTNFNTVELAGNIYMLGGNLESGGGISREMYLYDILKKIWQKKADLPGTSSSVASAAYGKLYLFDYDSSNNMCVFEYDPQTNTWANIASAPRSFNWVQTLNAKIYCMSSGNTVVDVFDPITRIWSQVASRPSNTSISDTAILAGELYLYATNGYMYCYSPASDLWTSISTNQNAAFIAPVYQDFYLLSRNSTNNAHNIYRYSLVDSTTSFYQSYLQEYAYFYQMRTVNNKVYIFAGKNSASGAETVIEYMPSISPWLSRKMPPFTNAYMASAAIGDKIYVAGGLTPTNSGMTDTTFMDILYEYDVQKDTWTKKASMSPARYDAAGAAVGGKFYMIGGYDNSFKYITNVEEYNPSSNNWAKKAALPYNMYNVAAAVYNGKIYTFGGISSNYVYEYDPTTDKWTQKQGMTIACNGASAAELNGKIYVAGGFDRNNNALKTLQIYDPVTNTWDTTKAAMPDAIGYCGAVTADGGIYVIGGKNISSGNARGNTVNTVYQYNPNKNEWFYWPSLDIDLANAAVVSVNDGIYVINGRSENSSVSTYTSGNYYAPVASIYKYAELQHLGSSIINLSGNLSRSYSDLSFDAPGFTLNVSRAYNSIDTRDSFINKGWTFGFSSNLKKEGNDTVIRMPDGSVRTFMVESNGTYMARDSRAKLTKSGEEHILTTPDHYQYRYNDKGYMYRMTDPNGNQINLTVDDKGKVTQVADAVGRTLTIAYDTSNRISTITESTTGRVVRYFYDSNGRLSEASTPDGGAIVYTYNSDGLLYQVKNYNNVVLEQFTYETQDSEQNNDRKRIKTAKLPSGITETYAYDIYEGSIITTTGSGTSARTTTTYFDRVLYPVLTTDAEGGQQRFEYNLDGGINRYGEVKTSTDRNGNTTRYEYDARGNVTKTIYPDLSSKLFTYDSEDNLTGETDELGYKTFYTYDSNNNLLKRIKPLDGLSDYSASADQNLYAIESYSYYTPAEANTMCGRSIGGLLKTSTDAAGNTIAYTYDARGNLATSKDSLNRTTTYSFNILGWLKQQTTPMGYTTKYYYDKCGRLLKKIMHGGESERYVYDLLGNLTQSISPKQFVDSSTYTAENIINAAVAPANTLGYRYTYTPAGLVETAKDPLNNTTAYTYDTFGNKTKETLPNGLAYTYTYDKLNRPTNKSYLDGSTTIKLEDYSYPLQTDGTIRQTNRVYFSGTTNYADTTYTYDFANRLLQTANPDGGVISNTYLPNGLAESTTDAMGNTTYFEYDPMNRMTKRWTPHDDSRHSLVEWQYDSANRVTQEKNYVEALGKGASPGWECTTLDYNYNIDSTVKDITTNGMGKTEYFYNDDGQIYREAKLQDETRSQRTDYAYNYWGKIATSTAYVENKDIDGNPDDSTLFGLTTSYTYDKNSNLEEVTYPNGETVSYEYDLLNRQTGEKRSVLNENAVRIDVTSATAYDNMGNVTSRKDEMGYITNYTYSPRGFLLRTTNAQNAVTAREYDLQGRLLKEYSPRALLTDEPGHIITPPANGGNWADPAAFTASNYTSYAYDKMGRLLTKSEYYRPSFSSPVRTLVAETNTYDKNGNLLTAKDALNNTTIYTYDNAGRVTKVSNALSQETQSSYDGLGRLTRQTDALDVATQYNYDLFGNVLEQSVDGVTVQSASYDYLGQPLTKTDANGNTTGYTYTLLGQPRSVTNAEGYKVRYWYDGMGNNRRSLDDLGKEVINNYDGWNRLLSVTQQSSGGGNAISRSTRYDVLGNPVYEIDERGNTTQYNYDKLSRLISVKNPLDQTSTIAYDANGNKVAETNWRGNTTTYRYDILDRLIGIIDPAGTQVETLTYTDNHRQATSTDALGHTTGFSYDNLGQLIATTDPEGYTSSQTYDAVGNIISKTDGNGNTTYYTYDNIRRLTNVVDAYGYMTRFGYDAVGNVLTQTNGLGCTTRYLYDHMNRPVLRSDPGGMANDGKTIIDESRIERFTYNPYGNLSSRKDKNGIITTNTYDIHGRKTRENVNGAITGYQYDNSGNLLSVEDAGGAIVRTYDALNRATSKTVPTFGTTTFNYDITDGLSQGQIGESTTIDGRTTTRVYDKTGRLTQVKDGSDTTNYTYYANGSLQTQTLPNGVTANYTYYNNNKLHTLENKKGSLTLEAYQYAYDGAGNMTAKQDVKGTTVYTYTPLNQLATVNEPNPRPSGPPPSEEGGNSKLTTYTYDAAGNRRSETVTTPPASFAGTPLASEGGEGQSVTTSYTVNEQNRLMHTEQTLNAQTIIEQYFYDNAGNMLGRRPEAFSDTSEESPTGSLGLSLLGQMEENDMAPALYSYNDKNQMVEAINGSSTVTNTFNAEGLRDSKTVGDVTTYYCYEYSRIIKELDSEGSEAYNTYGTNLISREQDGEKVYYIYNGHGDVTGLISASGTVIASYYYDAFGNILENNGNFGNPYRYAAYMYDEESRLYNLNARFYDAKLARFMQEDTYLGDRTDPLSLNLYAYCNNNPLVYWDPHGHSVSGRFMDYMYGLGYDYKEGPGGSAIWVDRTEGSVSVRDSNESQGNKVVWKEGSTAGKSTITITPYGGGRAEKLLEGKEYQIINGKAYYINQECNQVTRYQPNAIWHDDRTITYIDNSGTEKALYENIDFYVCRDDKGDYKAYLYNNVRTMFSVRGIDIQFNSPAYVGGGSTISFLNKELSNLVGIQEGEQYYIGADGRAHNTNSGAPPPTGPVDSVKKPISKTGNRADVMVSNADNSDYYYKQASGTKKCPVVATAMALSIYFDTEIAEEMLDFTWTGQMQWGNIGTAYKQWTVDNKNPQSYDERLALSLEAVKKQLDNDKPVLITVNGSSLMHYVTAVGYNGNGDKWDDFIILDPSPSKENKLQPLSERNPYDRGSGPMIVPFDYKKAEAILQEKGILPLP